MVVPKCVEIKTTKTCVQGGALNTNVYLLNSGMISNKYTHNNDGLRKGNGCITIILSELSHNTLARFALRISFSWAK